MISVGFSRVSKNARVGFVGNRLIVASQGTKVLRSACGSVQDLAGDPATVENMHVHTEIPFITIQPRIMRPISQSIPLASLEIRDAVFQELIRISPASNYSKSDRRSNLVAENVVACFNVLLDRRMREYSEFCRLEPR